MKNFLLSLTVFCFAGMVTIRTVVAETITVITDTDVNGVFFEGNFDGGYDFDGNGILVGDNLINLDFDPFGIVYFDLGAVNITGRINSVHLQLSLLDVSLGQSTNLNVFGFVDDGTVNPLDAFIGTQVGFATTAELIADSPLQIDLTSAFPTEWTDQRLGFRVQFPSFANAPEHSFVFESLEGNPAQAARLVFNVTAVPEPGTALFLCGLGAVGLRRHWKRRSSRDLQTGRD